MRAASRLLLLCLALLLCGCKSEGPSKPTFDWESTGFFFQLALQAAGQPTEPLGKPLKLGASSVGEVQDFLKQVSPQPQEVEQEADYLEADFGEYRWVFWLDSTQKLAGLSAIVRLQQDSKRPEETVSQLSSRFGVPERSTYSFELEGETVETDLDQSTWTTPQGKVRVRVPYDAERSFNYLVIEMKP